MAADLPLPARLLADALERVHESVHDVVDGLDEEALAWRPAPAANSIAWLVWHLTRVQDDHVVGVAERLGRPPAEQVWTAGGWARRFDLPFDDAAHGYGQTAAEVGRVRAPAALLAGYHDAVHELTAAFLAGLADDDYDEVVDTRWSPPVTAAARLVSVVNDTTQHVGQAAYVRGLWERR